MVVDGGFDLLLTATVVFLINFALDYAKLIKFGKIRLEWLSDVL